MKCVRLLLLLTVTTGVSATAQEPLTKFLNDHQMSNVPVPGQGVASPGGYVVYDSENKTSPADWYEPQDDAATIAPLISPTRKTISIPKEVSQTMKDGSFELSLFGFHPFGQIQTTGTLQYDQIDLQVTSLRDNNSFYKHLLLPGSKLETEILEYGENGNPRLWGNQHVWLILAVMETNGIKIISTGGKILGLSSGPALAKCPTLPALPPSGANGTGAGAVSGTGAGAVSGTGTGGGSGAGAGSAGGAGASGGSGAGAGSGSGSGAGSGSGSGAGSGGGSGTGGGSGAGASSGGGAGTDANPGGAFRYCSLDDHTVELRSVDGKPVQVGVQLLRVTPDGATKWKLNQQIVNFDKTKTIER